VAGHADVRNTSKILSKMDFVSLAPRSLDGSDKVGVMILTVGCQVLLVVCCLFLPYTPPTSAPWTIGMLSMKYHRYISLAPQPARSVANVRDFGTGIFFFDYTTHLI
jgi:hypothetical protein